MEYVGPIDRAWEFVQDVVSRNAAPETVSKTVAVLSAGISSLINVCDPEQIVFEGIYSHSPDFILRLRESVGLRQAHIRTQAPGIVSGKLGEAAQLIGVGFQVLQREKLWADQMALLPTISENVMSSEPKVSIYEDSSQG